MSLEVRWTDEAEITFDAIYNFIEQRWSTAIANDFKNKVSRTLTLISNNPLLYQETSIINIRKAVITKQSSVFYEVFPDHVALTFFWDNRQYPLMF